MDRTVFVKAYSKAPLFGPNRLGVIDRFFCRRIAANWDTVINIEVDGQTYPTTVGAEVAQEILMRAVAEGVLPASSLQVGGPQIDWDRLIDFIAKLLPLIIEFLKAIVLIFGL